MLMHLIFIGAAAMSSAAAEPSPRQLFDAIYLCKQDYKVIEEDCAELDRAIRNGGDRLEPTKRIISKVQRMKKGKKNAT